MASRVVKAPVTIQQASTAPVVDTSATEGLNFGDLSFYHGGFTLLPGRYVMSDLTVRMFRGFGTNSATMPERLGVMVTFIPLNDPKPDNAKQVFYSMGSGADKSYVPSPTGKGILPVPGAPGAGLNNTTNWSLFVKSLYDGGLPPGVFTNDTSTLEGTWINTTLIDEPAERSTFQSKTAEVQVERRVNKIAVALEVLDGGKPWENTGGVPASPVVFAEDQLTQPVNGAAVANKAATNAVGTSAGVALAPVRQMATQSPLPAAGQIPAATVDTADIKMAAINAISDVLEKSPRGVSRLLLKTTIFGTIKAKHGEDMAAAVDISYFNVPATLDALMSEVGYKVSGAMVVPA